MFAFADCGPLFRRMPVRAALGGLTFGVAMAAGTAIAGTAMAAPTRCGPHADIVAHLAERFDEEPVAVGLVSDGSLLEVLSASDGGTWTILVSRPDGTSCLVAAGEAGRELDKLVLDGPQI